jgi:hypothetical protein
MPQEAEDSDIIGHHDETPVLTHPDNLKENVWATLPEIVPRVAPVARQPGRRSRKRLFVAQGGTGCLQPVRRSRKRPNHRSLDNLLSLCDPDCEQSRPPDRTSFVGCVLTHRTGCLLAWVVRRDAPYRVTLRRPHLPAQHLSGAGFVGRLF